MDKLKEFLLLHREEMDVDSPASERWEDVAGTTGRVVAGLPRRVVRWVAAACLIALVGVGLWLVVKDRGASSAPVKGVADRRAIEPGTAEKGVAARGPKEEKAPVAERGVAAKEQGVAAGEVRVSGQRGRHKPRVERQAELGGEIASIDKSYSRLIDYQLRKLRATPLYAEDGNYFSFYVEQLKQMDQDENQVRKDIRTYGLTSEFLAQLINVYQQKLNLLKNLQTEINKVNNKVGEKQSPSVKAPVHYLNI